MYELGGVQRWLQSVITHHESVEGGIASPEARRYLDVGISDVESIVSRSAALSAVERIDIYRQSYHLRLVDCLRAEFPAVLAALGEGLFDDFAADYLRDHPSRSYTLNQLGARFPRYLAENRMHGEETEPDAPSWLDFLIDLASFERVVAEVYDGPGLEDRQPLGIEDLNSIPSERRGDARLIVAPCLRLLSTRFPVHRYVKQVRLGTTPPVPQPSGCFLAVFRRSYNVRTVRLSRVQHDIIASLSPELYPHLIIDRSTHSN